MNICHPGPKVSLTSGVISEVKALELATRARPMPMIRLLARLHMCTLPCYDWRQRQTSIVYNEQSTKKPLIIACVKAASARLMLRLALTLSTLSEIQNSACFVDQPCFTFVQA
ncbi:hypothetical protein WAI453_001529 [Rhynchosporium graminicola]